MHLLDRWRNNISYITTNASSKSIVIMCHGLNTSKDNRKNLALEKELLKHNISTLRFDFYAHGESDGDMKCATLSQFVDNIHQVLDHTKKLGYANIGLFAGSFGCVPAVIAASIENIHALVLVAPGMGQTSRVMTNFQDDYLKKTWIKSSKSIKTPTLIIHGSDDEEVEIELGKELHNTIKNSTLSIYEKADHSFSNPDDFQKLIEETTTFFNHHLKSYD